MAKNGKTLSAEEQSAADRAEDRLIEQVVDGEGFNAEDTAAAAAQAAADLAAKPAGDGPKKEPPPKAPEDPRDVIARNARRARDEESQAYKDMMATVDGAAPDGDKPAEKKDDEPATKIKVRQKDGTVVEMTEQQVADLYSKSKTLDERLDNAGALLSAVKTVAESGKGETDPEDRKAPSRATEDAGGDKSQSDKKGAPRAGEFTDEEIVEFIDAAQTGTQAEAISATRKLLDKVTARNPQMSEADLAEVVNRVVTTREQTDADRKALGAFVEKYPSLQTEPAFQAAAISLAHREMVQDLLKVGLTPDYMRTNANTPGKLVNLHKVYRSRGAQGVRTQEQILKAVGETDQFKRMMGANPPPKVDKALLDERRAAKETLPNQPAARSHQAVVSPTARDAAHQSAIQKAIAEAQRSRGQTVPA